MPQLSFDPSDPDDVSFVEEFIKTQRQRELNGMPLIESVEAGNVTGFGGDGTDPSQAQAMINTLWRRFGEKNREHTKAAAELFARDGFFTLESLATKLDESVDAARRWRFNLGRSLKRIENEMPNAPPLLEGTWDDSNGRQVYTMTPEVRDAILAQAV